MVEAFIVWSIQLRLGLEVRKIRDKKCIAILAGITVISVRPNERSAVELHLASAPTVAMATIDAAGLLFSGEPYTVVHLRMEEVKCRCARKLPINFLQAMMSFGGGHVLLVNARSNV